jgi:hypothetical protein
VDALENRVVPSGATCGQVASFCGPVVSQCSGPNTNCQQGGDCGQGYSQGGNCGAQGYNCDQGYSQGGDCGAKGYDCGQGNCGCQGFGCDQCGYGSQGNGCGQGGCGSQGGECNKPSTISGVVYLDAAAKGVYATSDTGLAGVNVTLAGKNDLGQTVSISETSGTNGAYSFTGVLPGTYTITYGAPAGDSTEAPAASQLPAGATATAGTISNIVVTSGSSLTVNLPDVAPSVTPITISGVVYLDPAKSGVYATSDSGLAGVTVTLTPASGPAVSVTTVAGGAYSFTGVLPGTYTITWTAASGDATEAPATGQYPAGATATAGTISNIVATSANNLTINLPEVAQAVIKG